MKKFTNIKAHGASLMVLTPSQMLDVKGGYDLLAYATNLITYATTSLTTTTSIVTDDKRRDRPGGGITTL